MVESIVSFVEYQVDSNALDHVDDKSKDPNDDDEVVSFLEHEIDPNALVRVKDKIKDPTDDEINLFTKPS